MIGWQRIGTLINSCSPRRCEQINARVVALCAKSIQLGILNTVYSHHSLLWSVQCQASAVAEWPATNYIPIADVKLAAKVRLTDQLSYTQTLGIDSTVNVQRGVTIEGFDRVY